MITESRIIKLEPQKDGRIYITELQVDDSLGELYFTYLGEKNGNFIAIASGRAKVINEVVKEPFPDYTATKSNFQTVVSKLNEEDLAIIQDVFNKVDVRQLAVSELF